MYTYLKGHYQSKGLYQYVTCHKYYVKQCIVLKQCYQMASEDLQLLLYAMKKSNHINLECQVKEIFVLG